MNAIFQQRKKDVLSKKDKSSIGGWDSRIKKLCDKINKSNNYYTTSSCSGRIMIIKDEDKKVSGMFHFVSHDAVSLKEFMKKIPRKGSFKFKQESPIVHIVCKSSEDAEKILKKSQETGWKRSAIISFGNNIVAELIGTEKIDFPLIKNGKLLVSENFLRIVLEKANKNIEKGWLKIEKLAKSL